MKEEQGTREGTVRGIQQRTAIRSPRRSQKREEAVLIWVVHLGQRRKKDEGRERVTGSFKKKKRATESCAIGGGKIPGARRKQQSEKPQTSNGGKPVLQGNVHDSAYQQTKNNIRLP